jgi:hypothetical protein
MTATRSGCNDQDIRALTYLARRLRDETHGAGKWDEAGTYAVFTDVFAGQNLATTMERVLGHATDIEAKTPGAVRRPFTPPPPKLQRAYAPKAADECHVHPGNYATNCRGCAADQLAQEDDPPKPRRDTHDVDVKAAADHARELMRAAKTDTEEDA